VQHGISRQVLNLTCGNTLHSSSMGDTESTSDDATSSSILAELTMKMTEVLNRASAPSQISSDHAVAPIGIKLDGNNYPLWS
jgi:hypothetical protein